MLIITMKSSYPDIPEMWRHEIPEIRFGTRITLKIITARLKLQKLLAQGKYSGDSV